MFRSDQTCVAAMPPATMAVRPAAAVAAVLSLRLLAATLLLACPAAAAALVFILVGGGTGGCTLAARLCTALAAARLVVLYRRRTRNAADEWLVRSPRQATVAWAMPSLTTAWASAPGAYLGRRSLQLRMGTKVRTSAAAPISCGRARS